MGFTFPSASPRPTFGALSLRAPSELRTPVDNLVPSMSSLAEPPKSSTHSTAREEMPSPLHARVSGGGPWTCTGIGTDLDVFTRRSLRGCGARRAGERGRRCSLYARLVRTSTAHTWTRIGRSLYLSMLADGSARARCGCFHVLGHREEASGCVGEATGGRQRISRLCWTTDRRKNGWYVSKRPLSQIEAIHAERGRATCATSQRSPAL